MSQLPSLPSPRILSREWHAESRDTGAVCHSPPSTSKRSCATCLDNGCQLLGSASPVLTGVHDLFRLDVIRDVTLSTREGGEGHKGSD